MAVPTVSLLPGFLGAGLHMAVGRVVALFTSQLLNRELTPRQEGRMLSLSRSSKWI